MSLQPRCNQCFEFFQPYTICYNGESRVATICNNCRTRTRHRIIERKRSNIPKYLHRTAKSRARRHGMEFDIEIADIIIPTHCPILGIKLGPIVGNLRGANKPSLDRILNNEGYTKGNIRVISWKANSLKKNLLPEDIAKLYNFFFKTLPSGN